MPTWGGILKELNDLIRERNGVPGTAFDDVRRKYLALLQKHTKRNVIMYATKFTSRDPDVSPELISIIDEDIQGLMEVVHGLRGPNLDLILHSPGGSIDAAEAFVVYLRSKFKNIRVFVPQLAQSAATMIACASNEIVMGKHSHLGPTDPQILVRTSAGAMYAPAQAVVEQFEKAVQECQDPKRLAAWIPMLSQYGPHLLVHCDNASALSLELVEDWLYTYMFKKVNGAREKAKDISAWLSNHGAHKTHGRHITRAALSKRGVIVSNLEDDQELQDLVLSVLHATTHTFHGTGAVKIIENHLGKAFLKQMQRMRVPIPQPLHSPQPAK